MNKNLQLKRFDDAINFFQKRGLTNRQFEILQLIACGYSGKEIADSLSISPFTVQNHVAKIKIILGMNKESELAVLFTVKVNGLSPQSLFLNLSFMGVVVYFINKL